MGYLNGNMMYHNTFFCFDDLQEWRLDFAGASFQRVSPGFWGDRRIKCFISKNIGTWVIIYRVRENIYVKNLRVCGNNLENYI